MKDRDEVQRRLQAALKRLIEDKHQPIRPERIAIDLGMSAQSVHSWKVGKRFPTQPVIEKIEHLYRVKIL